jgi:preprotein translocase SecE subunit
VARDRQRGKQRRRQRAGGAPGASRPGARSARDVGLREPPDVIDELGDPGVEEHDGTPAPDPLKHASAEVDEARLAEAGATLPGEDARGGEGGAALPGDEVADEPFPEDDAEVERAPDELEGDLVPSRRRGRAAGAELDVEAERAAAPATSRNRVLAFLRSCLEELRRVQWPDRRHVGQATAVVLGFVVLAGSYLGLLDAIWKPLVDAIL